MNTEPGTFTPLVLSVNGVLGKECSMFHKRVAEKIAKKKKKLMKVMKKLTVLLDANYLL